MSLGDMTFESVEQAEAFMAKYGGLIALNVRRMCDGTNCNKELDIDAPGYKCGECQIEFDLCADCVKTLDTEKCPPGYVLGKCNNNGLNIKGAGFIN